MNEKILKMYFEDKMKQIEIAKELNISKYNFFIASCLFIHTPN